MLRHKHLITTAALVLACAAPASAAPYENLQPTDQPNAGPSQDLRSPDARDAAEHRGLYAVEPEPGAGTQDLRSPDARDAARDLRPFQAPTPTVEVVDRPSSGFDWGDAGIGAGGMVALFGIAAGLALLVTRRRDRFHVAT